MARSEIEAEFRRLDLQRMTPAELLVEAARGGLAVFADGERLMVRGRRNAEHDLVQTLLLRKAELMPLLILQEEERHRFEERAAIAEFDGRLSRADAETFARRVTANRERSQPEDNR